MAFFISEVQVHQALLPWLGEDLLSTGTIVASAAILLRSFPQQNGDFIKFHEKIEKNIFMSVYQATGRSMKINLGDRHVRIYSSAFPHIADDLLAVYLVALRPTPIHFELIKRYSMERESLAALTALYLNYDHLQSPDEATVIRRMITSIYPPWRYEKWLKEKEEPPR